MQDKVLEIKNITKYFGKRKVIDDVSLYVTAGEIYGFLGPNGAGKTTTIKMILGLLSIDSGTIEINGCSVKKEFEKAMQYIGGIVENPDMYKYMSGLDNLKLYARLRNIGQDRIDEIVEMVGLKDRIKDKVGKYSLGMKQRLGLALTLLHSPKVLILDEPTNGLDPAGIRNLRDILKSISRKDKVAVFISSHLLSEMQLMCDKVAVIDKGKIMKVENLSDVLTDKGEGKKLIYQLNVNSNEKAMEIIKGEVDNVTVVEGSITFNIESQKIPDIIRLLVKGNIDIYSIFEKTHSLEEAFFDITSGGEHNA